jgi:hypothetical protein
MARLFICTEKQQTINMENLVYDYPQAVIPNGETKTFQSYVCGQYNSLVVACKTDQSGIMYVDFSIDNSNWDSTLTFDVAASINEVHRITVTRNYFRIRFYNNSGAEQTYFRMQTIIGHQQSLTSPLNGTVQSDADSIVARTVLMGQTDNGDWHFTPVTPEGHLEVAIHDPILPFGSLHVENMTPIFQSDAVYGINSGQVLAVTSLSGGATASNSMFAVNTGVTQFSQGVLSGRKRLRYRAGQGVIGRLTALFTAPVANSYQLAGFGHAESGVYVGYGNTSDLTDTRFGLLHVTDGVREVRTLTVTTGAKSASNVTITLNTVGVFTVAVTNASNIQRTVWEISQATYSGWDAYPSGATVIFVRKSAGVASGTYSFGAGTTGAAATFAQTKAGVASTDTFYPQAEWNGDKLDGTGASGVTIDKTKLNIFEFQIGYLGTDNLLLKAKVKPSNRNNSTWVTCHTIPFANSRTTPIFSNPSFPLTLAAYSAGSTTDLTVKCASFAGFIEGKKVLHGNRFTYFNQLTTVGATNLQALFTIMNTRYYAGRTNQAVINLLAVMGAIKHSSPVVLYLIRGGTLAGNPNFVQLASNSCSVYDVSATTVTYSTGDQLVWTGHMGDTGEIDHHFGNGDFNAEEITLQPGEWITLAVKSTFGSPSYVTGSLNTREDQ